jgi:hypothetical protein
LRSSPPATRQLLTQKGLARALPAGVQRLLLGDAICEPATRLASPLSPLPDKGDKRQSTSSPLAADPVAVAVRVSHPSTTAAPWAVRALSSLAQRRMLHAVSSALDVLGCTSSTAALDTALALTALAMARQVLPYARLQSFFPSALLIAVAAGAWGATALRALVDSKLQALDNGATFGARDPAARFLSSAFRVSAFLVRYYKTRKNSIALRAAAGAAVTVVAIVCFFLLRSKQANRLLRR